MGRGHGTRSRLDPLRGSRGRAVPWSGRYRRVPECRGSPRDTVGRGGAPDDRRGVRLVRRADRGSCRHVDHAAHHPLRLVGVAGDRGHAGALPTHRLPERVRGRPHRAPFLHRHASHAVHRAWSHHRLRSGLHSPHAARGPR